mmetsp:Transcript_14018/g.32595  ORF Transcript_14018/g.32595 Transcript_14018/m.32595 type:complete len:639 (+) Transcript_14018:39-1955(+)
MSGDTQDISMESETVNSALIWTDNPELEYFRSMMANKTMNKLASGLDVEDSLIGDSTVREMLEIGEDNESESRRYGLSLQRQGLKDTSGLSDGESNTVDNIYVEDESIFAMKKTLNRVLDDVTIETIENKDPTPLEIGNNMEQDLFRHPSREQKFIVPNPYQSDSPPKYLPERQLFPQLDTPETRNINSQGQSDGSTNIPGVIFVTEGHSSVVRTCPNLGDSNSKKFKENIKIGREKHPRLPRHLFISVTLIVIIASTVSGVLVYRVRSEKSASASASSSSSSSWQNDDFAVSEPNAVPGFEPTNLRGKPDAITFAPTPDSSTDETPIQSLEPSFVLNDGLPEMPIGSAIDPPFVPPQSSPSASPTKLTIFSQDEDDFIEPTTSPTPEAIIFPEVDRNPTPTIQPTRKDLPTSIPTMKPTILIASFPVPILPRSSPSISPTKSISFSQDEDDFIKPTTSPTPKTIIFPEDTSNYTPTIKPTSKDPSASTPTMPPAMEKQPSEAPTQMLTGFSTTLSTVFSSEASTCASTIKTDKTCYKQGDSIQILFENCEPTPSDWIGIYPTRQGVKNLHNPSGWIWTCGDQLCSNSVASGTATILDATGFGSFRALLLRSNDNDDTGGYSAYAIGNRFTISSRCFS